MKRHARILVATALLLAGTALAAVLTPARPVQAQDSCSASCRAVYGNCYKSSQNREQCQQQWQRCLEQCRKSKR